MKAFDFFKGEMIKVRFESIEDHGMKAMIQEPKGGKDMRLITYLCLGLVLVLAMGMGCSSGGSSNGGSSGVSSSTGIGTWNLVSSTGGNWPKQITFLSNGTGSYSGAGGANPSGTFTWTRQGNTIINTFPNGSTVTYTVVTEVGNTATMADPAGTNGTYSRA
jgi:hypothetical protein